MRFCTVVILLSGFLLIGCSHVQRGFMAATGSPFSDSDLSYELGSMVFQEHCARCHGATGTGNESYSTSINASIPNFTDGSYTKSLGITAANIKYGKRSEMPAFSSLLNDKEIWSVAKFVLSLRPPVKE